MRNALTQEPIPFEVSSGKYIHRVAPLRIILDDDYFVKVFDSIMVSRDGEAGRSPCTDQYDTPNGGQNLDRLEELN